MLKIAVIVHADLYTYEGTSRVYNALHTVKEFQEAGDYVALVFEGAGTRAAVQIATYGHPMNALFKEVEEAMTGICRFCADYYKVTDQAEAMGINLLGGHHQHPSIRNFMVNGYEILTF